MITGHSHKKKEDEKLIVEDEVKDFKTVLQIKHNETICLIVVYLVF